MRKMKLNLDDVTVESFDVLPELVRGYGTIEGRDSPPPLMTAEEECYGGGTPVSCPGTCGKTCPVPCDTSPQTCSCLASCPCDFEMELPVLEPKG